jgi:transcriptional regulator with XRE-family HTH domain
MRSNPTHSDVPEIRGIDVLVGQRLRAARRAAGLTQQDIGQRLGLTFQQIQKYEIAQNRICASRLFLIADMLGVNVNYFFEDVDPSAEQSPPPRARDWQQLVERVQPLSDPQAMADTLRMLRNSAVRRRLTELVAGLTAAK